MQLYDKIFQVANENMRTNGLEFNFGQAAFESILYKNPRIIEVSEFESLSEMEFLTAVYLRFLNRLPDESARREYIKLAKNIDEEAYKKFLIMQALTNSPEFKNLDKKVVGLGAVRRNFLNRGIKYRLNIRAIAAKSKFLYSFRHYIFEPIWKRLPNNIKNVIRVICGREKK